MSSQSAAMPHLRAWIDFCQTNEGRREYWNRFGDYLFTDREIPRELLLQPLPKRRRQRKPRQLPPDGLKTAAQAAAKLGCSIKTLKSHVAVGALKYVALGHGRKRQRKMFTDADLDEFIANQTRKDVPCPSIRTETAARRSSISTSRSKVLGFMEARSRRRDAKPKL
jgi:hypothetical protein